MNQAAAILATVIASGPPTSPPESAVTPPTVPGPTPSLESAADAYIAAGTTERGRSCRRRGVVGFLRRYGDLAGWMALSVEERRRTRSDQVAFVGHALVHCHVPVDVLFAVTSECRWGKYITDAYPDQAARFREQAADLGFCERETHRMWAYLAKICMITGLGPDQVTADVYADARNRVHDAVVAVRSCRPKTLSTPLFDLDAVMFHRGQAPPPDIRRRWTGRPVKEVTWDELAARAPVLVATMRRYLDQCLVSLRPSSVACFDTTFRQLASVLLAADPPVVRVADITREHIEAYKRDLVTRPGRHGKPLSKTTLGMRVGHLHTFFIRIIEWGYEDAPARIPVYASDRPRLDKPLPKFLDDAQAVALMNAARNLPDPLDRLMVIVLARTGMRRGELLGLTVDAVVQIGTGYWLRTPVGKLHTDRYIPLHPQLKELLDDWVATRPDWQATSLLLTDRGRPIPPTRVDKAVQKAATAARSATSIPTSCGTPWPPRPSTAACHWKRSPPCSVTTTCP
jgi:integrase